MWLDIMTIDEEAFRKMGLDRMGNFQFEQLTSV